MTASLFRWSLCGLLQQLYPTRDSFEFMRGEKEKLQFPSLGLACVSLLQQQYPTRDIYELMLGNDSLPL